MAVHLILPPQIEGAAVGGELSYSQDLAETLADLVINAGQKELAPLFDAIDDLRESLANASGQPGERLVSIMNDLIKLEPYGHLPEPGFELVKSAIQELRSGVIAV